MKELCDCKLEQVTTVVEHFENSNSCKTHVLRPLVWIPIGIKIHVCVLLCYRVMTDALLWPDLSPKLSSQIS